MRKDLLALGALALVVLPGAAPVGDVAISVDALRSKQGLLQLCLTREARYFPDCENDPGARRMTVPADSDVIRLRALSPGQYALAVVHDENGNNKLDTFAGIPREGVGFSRNPKFTFGPPRFSKVLFAAGDGETFQRVRIRYFL